MAPFSSDFYSRHTFTQHEKSAKSVPNPLLTHNGTFEEREKYENSPNPVNKKIFPTPVHLQCFPPPILLQHVAPLPHQILLSRLQTKKTNANAPMSNGQMALPPLLLRDCSTPSAVSAANFSRQIR